MMLSPTLLATVWRAYGWQSDAVSQCNRSGWCLGQQHFTNATGSDRQQRPLWLHGAPSPLHEVKNKQMRSGTWKRNMFSQKLHDVAWKSVKYDTCVKGPEASGTYGLISHRRLLQRFVSGQQLWKTLPERLWLCAHSRVSTCVLIKVSIANMAVFAVIIRVLHWSRPFFLCLFFSFYKAMLLQQILAVAHFDSRIPREAPVPARCQILVGAVSTVALQELWASRQSSVSTTWDGDNGGEARAFLSWVCGWRRWLGGVGRRGHDWKVADFFIGWKQVGGQKPWRKAQYRHEVKNTVQWQHSKSWWRRQIEALPRFFFFLNTRAAEKSH